MARFSTASFKKRSGTNFADGEATEVIPQNLIAVKEHVHMLKHKSVTSRIFHTLSQMTGHDPEDLSVDLLLEEDLGLDSLKKTGLMYGLVESISIEERAKFTDTVPADTLMAVKTLGELIAIFEQWEIRQLENQSGAPNVLRYNTAREEHQREPRHKPEELILEVISRITGHERCDLDYEMNLETDLGLDSLKTVELMNGLLQLLNEENRQHFLNVNSDSVVKTIPTIGDLARLFRPYLDNAVPDSQQAHSQPPTAHAGNGTAPIQETNGGKPVAVEILNAQLPFLVSHWAVSTCSLCSRVRVQGVFEERLAQQTWDRLLVRHPALRSRFTIPSNSRSFKDYRYEVLNSVRAPAFVIQDLRETPEQLREEVIKNIVSGCVERVWALDQWPLHEFFACRLSDDLYDVFFSNHHLVSDGLSNQQIVREWLEIYETLSNGAVGYDSPTTSVERYCGVVRQINEWNNSEENSRFAEFTRDQGRSAYAWLPFGNSTTTSRATVGNYHFSIDTGTTGALIRSTTEARVSLNSILVAAFLRSVVRLGEKSPNIILNIPTSGRVYPNIDASGIIGCFAQNLALTFPAPSNTEDLRSLLERVDREICTALANGYDRTQTRLAASAARDNLNLENGQITEPTASFIRAGIKSNLYLPFIGQTRLKQSYGPLTLREYQAATTTNSRTLDTLIEIFHDQLSITVNYDRDAFTDNFVAMLANEFSASLNEFTKIRQRSQPNSPKQVPDKLLSTQVLKVAEEVLHRPITLEELHLDLEGHLGADSLDRIRIVSRLERFVGPCDRQKLLACRTLANMVAVLCQDVSTKVPQNGQPAETMKRSKQQWEDESLLRNGKEPHTLTTPLKQILDQCQRTPDAIAVMTDDRNLTYAELNAASSQVAIALQKRGIKRGMLVGLLVHRSAETLVGILGILKAGAAYVPIDPDYPLSRNRYIIEHAGLPCVITQCSLLERLSEILGSNHGLSSVLVIDNGNANSPGNLPPICWQSDWSETPVQDVPIHNASDDLMVVLYTSGSTGTPKGVMLTHQGYANRFEWMQELFPLSPGDRVAQKTSICFDVSLWELLWPLTVGAIVCPVGTETVRNPWRLSEWIQERAITIIHFVPSMFGEFLNALSDSTAVFNALRWIIFSGEALPVPNIQRWIDKFGSQIGLANLYGPTEASIDVTAHIITDRPGEGVQRIPIGKAMKNNSIVILDHHMLRVPRGTIGELWIGGIQLAKGYLHDTERTKEAFRPNLYPIIPSPVLYRSGDLACELEDGSFEYHGRVDSQVKIRGFRVELGEVEAALSSLPDIQEAVVLARNHDAECTRLEAYVVGKERGFNELRTSLSQILPSYMIPHQVFWLRTLPKTDNGKTNRTQLKSESSSLLKDASVVATAAPVAATANDYELGPAQRWLLQYFPSPHLWAGYTRFTYLQPLDGDLFNVSLNKLVERHCALRSTFFQHNGNWRQRFLTVHPDARAAFIDGTHLSHEERETEIHNFTINTARSFRLDQWPLWKILIVKEAERRYEIIIVGHHIISDMISNGVLFKDLWKLYGKMLAGDTPIVEGHRVSYEDYLRALRETATKDILAQHADYWKGQFPSPEYAFRLPLDHHAGNNTENSSRTQRFTLDTPEVANLRVAQQASHSRLYTLLVSPLYGLMAKLSGQRWVVISHRMHGRDLGLKQGFAETVGNFAVHYPVGLNIAPTSDLVGVVQDLNTAFDKVPAKGLTFDLIGTQLPRYLYPDTNLTPVRVNYLGDRAPVKSQAFESHNEHWDQRLALPDQIRLSLIECFLSFESGKLCVDINYSANFLSDETIQNMGKAYLAELKTLIDQINGTVPRNLPPQSIQHSVRRASEPAGCLSGKVALITGAGLGIGRALAKKLSTLGASVVLTSRSIGNLNDTVDEIKQYQPNLLACQMDVTSIDDVARVVEKANKHFGGIDILINNAGVNMSSLVVDSDATAWRYVLEVNLLGAYHCIKAALPLMLQRGTGKVINIGSAASLIGYPLFSAYCASKHALIGLTRSVAEEVKQNNIQVNAICPAFVDTRLTPEAFRNVSISTERIADVVAFLASSQSDSMTGGAIEVYGKQDMYSYGSERMDMIKTMTRNFKPGMEGRR